MPEKTLFRSILLMSSLLLVFLALTGCNENKTDFCDLYEPVYYSGSKDTPETIDAVMLNNLTYETVCK